MLLRQAIVAGFDFVDLEIDVIDKSPLRQDVKRIVSYHNIREVPENLETASRRCAQEDADVVKIVVTAQQPSDNLRVLALTKNAPEADASRSAWGTSARRAGCSACGSGCRFPMRRFNKERRSRRACCRFRSCRRLYSIESITPETKVFGVIGDPVGHSLSPLIHNAVISAARHQRGVPAVPRAARAGGVPGGVRGVPVTGYSVTMPHKEAPPRGRRAGRIGAAMGAANTLLRTTPASRAVNTDAQAALDSLVAHLPLGPDDEPGGPDRALGADPRRRRRGPGHRACAGPGEGAVIITNRTAGRGQSLAEEVGCKFVEWSARHNVVCDTLINCTSVGMHPNLDESADPSQLPQARPDGVRHHLHAGNDDADPRGQSK